MLFKVNDHRGKERWINPIYVKSLVAKNEDETIMEIGGWSVRLRVRASMDDVAMMVNAAMPDAAEALAAAIDDEEAQRARAAAAAAAG